MDRIQGIFVGRVSVYVGVMSKTAGALGDSAE